MRDSYKGRSKHRENNKRCKPLHLRGVWIINKTLNIKNIHYKAKIPYELVRYKRVNTFSHKSTNAFGDVYWFSSLLKRGRLDYRMRNLEYKAFQVW